VTYRVLEVAWWNQGASFIAFHALHYLAAAAVIAGLTRWAIWRRARSGDRAIHPVTTALFGIELTVWARYAVMGLILGTTWVWHETESPWTHALRVAILVIFVAPVVRWVRGRYAKHQGRNPGTGVPVTGWLLAKLVLVIIALAIEVLLKQWLSLFVAAEVAAFWLAITVAVAGPLIHGRLMAREVRPIAESQKYATSRPRLAAPEVRRRE
jgi:hypothetical protein